MSPLQAGGDNFRRMLSLSVGFCTDFLRKLCVLSELFFLYLSEYVLNLS